MANVQSTVQSVKETVTAPLPTPPDMARQVSPNNLKARLNGGEPALSILDVRPKQSFDNERIMGAISIPGDVAAAATGKHALEASRDIFLYGDSDEEATQAAAQLRETGYTEVAVIKGGIEAWKAIGGAVEGIATN